MEYVHLGKACGLKGDEAVNKFADQNVQSIRQEFLEKIDQKYNYG